jgi:hypothetical protein
VQCDRHFEDVVGGDVLFTVKREMNREQKSHLKSLTRRFGGFGLIQEFEKKHIYCVAGIGFTEDVLN